MEWVPHPLTGNINPKNNIESIRQSVKNLFLLEPYDIPFIPHTFTNLRHYLFENITNITSANLTKRIEWTLSTYEKRIKLHDVKVVPFNSDDGIEITITYLIKAINIVDTFVQSFQRVR
jgi:phage baseplate assembly protein W